MQSVAKGLIVIGLVIALVGVIFYFFDKIPLVGKLPGDISLKGQNYSF